MSFTMLNETLTSSGATKIKILLLNAELTAAEIARDCGVHRSFVTHVISGRVKTKRIRSEISRRLQVPVSELWPAEK